MMEQGRKSADPSRMLGERAGEERAGDRGRQTDRRTDRQTERQRERETERDRQTDRQRDRRTDGRTDRQTDRLLTWSLPVVQEGGRMEGLRLVSRQFRKQRLAVWAAGRGPHPYLTAMVFWLCETVLWHGALLAAQEGGRMEEGLRLVSRQFRKQRLAQVGD